LCTPGRCRGSGCTRLLDRRGAEPGSDSRALADWVTRSQVARVPYCCCWIVVTGWISQVVALSWTIPGICVLGNS
jgi:hypothetical protein